MKITITNTHWRVCLVVNRLSTISLLAILLLAACSTTKSGLVPSHPHAPSLHVNMKIESDQRVLLSVAGQLENTRSELIALHQSGGWSKRGYFTSEEHNQIERFYFRFVVGHTTLWDIINSYGEPQTYFSDEETVIKARVLLMYAELLLAYHASFIVAEFMDDPVAVAKLNEAFFRSEIPRGTYDRLYRNVTSKDNANMLAAAWLLYLEDANDRRPEERMRISLRRWQKALSSTTWQK